MSGPVRAEPDGDVLVNGPLAVDASKRIVAAAVGSGGAERQLRW